MMQPSRCLRHTPGQLAALEAAQAAADSRAADELTCALRALSQLPRLMRAAGVARVRIDADGQIVLVYAQSCAGDE